MYSTRQACSMTGATFRQVDYWAREGVVRPTVEARGSGTQRGYSFEDVVRLSIVKGMAGLGVDFRNVKKVLELTSPMPEGVITVGGSVRVVVDVGQVVRELTGEAARG